MSETLLALFDLLQRRNVLDAEISRIIGRPAIQGHIGEFIGAELLDIELNPSACHQGFDGHFRSGNLAGKSVNVKFYGKQEAILDVREACLPDFYLVLTGEKSKGGSSRGTTRPCTIQHVYLFDAVELLAELRLNGVKICEATSVRKAAWQRAEVFPSGTNNRLVLSTQQIELLRSFATGATPIAS